MTPTDAPEADDGKAERDEFWGGVWWRPDSDGRLRNASAGECAAEIQRLRARLAKIEHAPVPVDNEIAVTLKRWASSRDGELMNSL